MNSDFKELLRIFSEEDVKYLIVRGYTVMHHGQPRSTKDLEESEDVPYLFLSKQDLIRSKTVAGRAQDLADLDGLK